MPDGRGRSLKSQLRRATFVAVAAMLAIVVASVLLILRLYNTEQVLTTRFFDGVRTSGETFAAAVDQETGVRGYLLTAEPGVLQQYEDGRAEQERLDEELRRILRQEDDLLPLLATAGDSLDVWRQEFAEPAVRQTQDTGRNTVASAEVERGKVLFDAYRTDFGEFESALLETRAAAKQDMDRALITLILAFGAIAAGAVLLTYLAVRLLRRWVTDPLERLAEQTRRVARGEITRRVEPVGPTEVAALARDIEAMRARIVDELVEVADSRREIEAAKDTLEEQAQELRRSNAELEQFAYVASHDLQEPLRKVASFCQLLQKRYGGQLDERADQYIAFAVDGAKRMQELIQDLLAFSRVGRVGHEVGEVDLDACLDRALRSLSTALDESGARVESDPLPVVTGDATLLTQVFQNLLGNAVKFRGADAPRVRITCRQEDEHWQVSVRDNGIGIPEQYSEKVFVVFQRLHPRDEYDGTGIGLAMCRKIVEFHGGHLWLVQPDDGPGAEFRFTLPVAARIDELAVATTGATADGKDPA
ncbi:MAG TPA: ATP-binding protein [Jiangellales bacterium]|nr:ATP-binding protein [Jiangellales bacterium]